MADTPVWLWSADASRILWGNAAAAAIFNAASSVALTGHTIDPKGSAALQIARLAGTLPHGRGTAARAAARFRRTPGRRGDVRLLPHLARRPHPRHSDCRHRACRPAAFASRQGRSVCSPAAANRWRCLPPTGPCYRPRHPGALVSAAPRTSPGCAPARSAPTALAAGRAEGEHGGSKFSITRIGADASTVLLVAFAAEAKPAEAKPAPVERPAKPQAPVAPVQKPVKPPAPEPVITAAAAPPPA